MIRLPDFAARMLTRLHECGYDAYVVGGCVRDSLLGRRPADWDITTSATPEETAAVFAAAPFSVHITGGIRHGTLTVSLGRESCEITTFRTEGIYSDHRRPDAVGFVRDVRQDLARRDFTVNAMAYTPADPYREEQLLDLFGGQADLAAGCIRAVGEAEQRFREDALRILRGIRFAARLGFTVEDATADAMHRCAPLLSYIAPERIGDELRGILCGACPSVLTPFPDILALLLPGFCASSLPALCRADDPTVRLACLCAGCPADTLRDTLIRCGFGNAVTERVLRFHTLDAAPLSTHADRCAVADAIGETDTDAYFAYRMARSPADASLAAAHGETRALFAPGVCYSVATLALGGHDLIREAGIKPGVEIGRLLRTLTDAVIRGELPNERDALLRAALCLREKAKS